MMKMIGIVQMAGLEGKPLMKIDVVPFKQFSSDHKEIQNS